MAQRLATRAEICGELGTPGGVAPELNAATDDQVALWADVAAQVCAPQRYRGSCSQAHALLTAHLLRLAPGLGLGPGGGDFGEEAGPLTAEADGPASRSFGAVVSGEAAAWDDAVLATTAYGRMFLMLRRSVRGFTSVCVANGVRNVPH